MTSTTGGVNNYYDAKSGGGGVHVTWWCTGEQKGHFRPWSMPKYAFLATLKP